MSVINQMLRDLDKRGAAARDGPIAGDVRPMPREKERLPWRKVAVAMMVIGFLAAGTVLWVGVGDSGASAPRLATQSATSAVGPVLATSLEPPMDAAPSVRRVALGSTEMEGEPPAIEEQLAARLKMASTMDVPPGMSARDAPRTAMARPAQKAMVPDQGSELEPPFIEKRIRNPGAQERSDTEYQGGVALLNQGRPQEALESLREALRIDGANASARVLMANLFIEDKKLDEARALLAEGLAQKPAQPSLALRLARIQVELGDLAGAADTLRNAAPAAANLAEYRGYNAALLQRLARHKDAIREFEAALSLAPGSGVWWMGLGLSLDSDQRPAEARQAFERARATGSLSTELDRFVEHRLRPAQ